MNTLAEFLVTAAETGWAGSRTYDSAWREGMRRGPGTVTDQSMVLARERPARRRTRSRVPERLTRMVRARNSPSK